MSEEGFRTQFTQYSDFMRRHAADILNVVTTGIVAVGGWVRWGSEASYRHFASMITWLFNENIWQQVHSYLQRAYAATASVVTFAWRMLVSLTGSFVQGLGHVFKECLLRAFSAVTISIAILYGLSRAGVDYAVSMAENLLGANWDNSSAVEYMKQGLSGLIVAAVLYPILLLPYWVIGIALCLTQVGELFKSSASISGDSAPAVNAAPSIAKKPELEPESKPELQSKPALDPASELESSPVLTSTLVSDAPASALASTPELELASEPESKVMTPQFQASKTEAAEQDDGAPAYYSNLPLLPCSSLLPTLRN